MSPGHTEANSPQPDGGRAGPELGGCLQLLEETVHTCEWVTDTRPSLCLAWFCPGKATSPERACPCKAKVSGMDPGVPHSKGRPGSSPPSPHPPHAGLSLWSLPPCRARSPHPARDSTQEGEGGQRTCPGSCVGTSGGRQVGRAAEVEATCSSKLLMRGFLVGSGLASGVTLLRLMSGLGPFFAS